MELGNFIHPLQFYKSLEKKRLAWFQHNSSRAEEEEFLLWRRLMNSDRNVIWKCSTSRNEAARLSRCFGPEADRHLRSREGNDDDALNTRNHFHMTVIWVPVYSELCTELEWLRWRRERMNNKRLGGREVNHCTLVVLWLSVRVQLQESISVILSAWISVYRVQNKVNWSQEQPSVTPSDGNRAKLTRETSQPACKPKRTKTMKK